MKCISTAFERRARCVHRSGSSALAPALATPSSRIVLSVSLPLVRHHLPLAVVGSARRESVSLDAERSAARSSANHLFVCCASRTLLRPVHTVSREAETRFISRNGPFHSDQFQLTRSIVSLLAFQSIAAKKRTSHFSLAFEENKMNVEKITKETNKRILFFFFAPLAVLAYNSQDDRRP